MNILDVLNTDAGRYSLAIKDNLPITKYTNNSVHQLLGTDEEKVYMRGHFWINPQVSQILEPTLTKIDIANEYKHIEDNYEAFLHFSGIEEKRYKYPQIYLDTDSFNSNSGGDGFVAMEAEAVYATARDAATGDTANNTIDIEVGNSEFAGLYYISRGFLPFDTSGLSDAATVTAPCTLRLNNANINGGTANKFYIVSNTQASGTALTTADYDQLGAVDCGDGLMDFTSLGTQSQTLNATGRGLISLTGFTQLGLKHTGDFENTTPTGVHRADASSSNDVDAGDRPFLTVTYTLPAGGAVTGYKALLNVGI